MVHLYNFLRNTSGAELSTATAHFNTPHIGASSYPDLHTRSIGRTQPISVGTEAQSGDDVIVWQSVQVFAIIQIP